MQKTIAMLAAAAIGFGMASAATAQVQGVTDTEVVIGTHTDMSGVFAAFGAPSVKAANLYFDEINGKGGVHGRKIRFVVEDHAYQMPKANQAINKLINSDKVFAMILALGTPMNIAAFKQQDAKKIPDWHRFPPRAKCCRSRSTISSAPTAPTTIRSRPALSTCPRRKAQDGLRNVHPVGFRHRDQGGRGRTGQGAELEIRGRDHA